MSGTEEEIGWVNQLRGLVEKELNKLTAIAEYNDIFRDEFGIVVEVENNLGKFPILSFKPCTTPSVMTPIKTPIDPPQWLPMDIPTRGSHDHPIDISLSSVHAGGVTPDSPSVFSPRSHWSPSGSLGSTRSSRSAAVASRVNSYCSKV